MRKTFNNIIKGDIIYVGSIKDSVVQQDCNGNIIVEYYVKDVTDTEDFYTLELTVERMSPTYKGGFERREDAEEHFIYPNKNVEVYIEVLNPPKDSTHGLNINKTIIATTKRGVFEKLVAESKNFEEKINELDSLLKKYSLKQETMKMLMGIAPGRIDFEEEEKEYSLEEVASMAL